MSYSENGRRDLCWKNDTPDLIQTECVTDSGLAHQKKRRRRRSAKE